MAQQISKGITFSTYPGVNSQVTADLINKHVDDATLLPGAISSQTSSSSVPAASELLVLNSTSSSLNRISVQNMIQNAAPTAAVGTKGVVQIGDGINVTTDGVISYTAANAANGIASSCSLTIPATPANGTANINVLLQTGNPLGLTLGQTYTVTLKPVSSAPIGNEYSFIFGAKQITVDAAIITKATLVIPNVPNEVLYKVLINCYIELIGTAGVVTPSTGDGITVVQQTVGLTSQPVMKLVPATTASIGGIIVGTGLSASSTGVVSVSNGFGVKTTCYTPAAGSASTNYTHTLSGKCNVVEAIIIGGGGAGGAGAVITGAGTGARWGGGGGGGGAITLVKIPLMAVGSPVGSIGTIDISVGGGGTCVVSTGTTGNNGGAGSASSIKFLFSDTLLPLHNVTIEAKGGSGGTGGTLANRGQGGAGGVASTAPIASITNFYRNTTGAAGDKAEQPGKQSTVAYQIAGNLVDRCFSGGAGGAGGGSWDGTQALTNGLGGYAIHAANVPSIFSRANTLASQFFTPISPSIGGNGVNGSAQSSTAATTCPNATVGGGGGGGGSSKVSSKGGSGGNGVVYIIEYYDPLYAGTVF